MCLHPGMRKAVERPAQGAPPALFRETPPWWTGSTTRRARAMPTPRAMVSTAGTGRLDARSIPRRSQLEPNQQIRQQGHQSGAPRARSARRGSFIRSVKTRWPRNTPATVLATATATKIAVVKPGCHSLICQQSTLAMKYRPIATNWCARHHAASRRARCRAARAGASWPRSSARDDSRARLESIGRRLRQTAIDRQRPRRRTRPDRRCVIGVASLSRMRPATPSGVAAANGMDAAGVLVEQHAEGEHVGARVDRLALQLFGRHVAPACRRRCPAA